MPIIFINTMLIDDFMRLETTLFREIVKLKVPTIRR